jgi:hypothetical protein
MKNSNFEIFSPAMEAKLDMKYRRRLQTEHRHGAAESWKRAVRPLLFLVCLNVFLY